MEDKEQRIKISFDTNADAVGGKVDGLTNKLDGTTKATDNVTQSQKKATKSSKDLGGGLEDLGGPIGGAISGFKTMIKQMWLLVANPIGAILVAIAGALALVFKAFTSTNDGADKLEQILAGLGATIDVLRDRFLKLISLDFKGAFSGVGDEIAKEFKQAAKLAEALQEVEDASRNLGVSRAKLNRDLAASKELITDETASYADKKKAIEDVRKAEDLQTSQELANAEKKLAAIKEKNALSDTSDIDLQKQADAESAVFKLQEEQSTNKRAFNKLDKKADNEEKGRLKELSDAAKAKAKEQREAEKEKQAAIKALLKEGLDAETALRKANEDINDKTEEDKLARQRQRANDEIKALKKKGIDVVNITRLNDLKFNELEKELSDKRKEEKKTKDEKEAEERRAAQVQKSLEQKEQNDKVIEADKILAAKLVAIEAGKEKQKQEIQAQGLDAASRGVSVIAQIFGKNKKVQKAAMIAEGAISIGKQIAANNVANIGALATPQAILTSGASAVPVIALNNISTGLGIASTIASTATALKSLGGGGGGLSGASSGGGPTGSGASTPQVAFQASSENQISNTISQNARDQPPIQAFVVGKDVTTQQSLDNNKINSNSI